MDGAERETIEAIEDHEVLMWQRCVEAIAALPGDPFGVVLDLSGPVPMTAMTVTDSDEYNRIVGLGVRSPADPGAIETILRFYRDLGMSQFRVEVAPVALPAELPDWLEEAGLHRFPLTVTKVWEVLSNTTAPGDVPEGIVVRRLDSSDTEAVGKLTAVAYGAFDAATVLGMWFDATVGRPGFIYYGAFEDDRLVASGGSFIEGDMGWFGMAVTHPRFRSRNIQQCLTARRVQDARELGCRIVHGEIRTDLMKSPRAQVFKMSYVKPSYSSVRTGQAP